MPVPPQVIAAGVAAAGSAASSALSAASNGKQNRRSRRWAEEQYEKEKADNLEFWRMQNEYNSPQAQMQRLKEGGLNPNLVYGQSSGAASGQASPISSAKTQGAQFKATDYSGIASGAVNSINTYYDTQVKQATANNLQSQNNVNEQKALLVAAQTADTIAGTKGKGFDNISKSEAAKISAQANRNLLHQQAATLEATRTDTTRKNQMHSGNLTQQQQNLINSKSANQQTQIKNDLYKYELILQKKGIHKGDPMYMRMMGQATDYIIKNTGKPGLFKWLNSFK